MTSPPPGPPRPAAPSPAIEGNVGEPSGAPSIGRPQGITRLVASGCLEALSQAVALLEKKEQEGRLEEYGEYIESVVDLRDKLEFYLKTAAPGDAFQPTAADIIAANNVADFLEMP